MLNPALQLRLRPRRGRGIKRGTLQATETQERKKHCSLEGTRHAVDADGGVYGITRTVIPPGLLSYHVSMELERVSPTH